MMGRKIMAGASGFSITSHNHPNLLALWDMGDTVSGSTLIDLSPNGKDGNMVGPTIIGGHLGNALRFDGSNDYVSLPLTLASTSGAIVFWFRSSNLSAGTIVLSFTNNATTQEYFLLQGNAGSVGASPMIQTGDFDGTNQFATPPGSLTVNTWHHIVLQSTGSAYQIYIDAVLMTANLISGSNDGKWSSVIAPLTNCAMNRFVRSSGTSYFIGDEDAMWLYDRHLTQAEVTQHYNGGVGVQ